MVGLEVLDLVILVRIKSGSQLVIGYRARDASITTEFYSYKAYPLSAVVRTKTTQSGGFWFLFVHCTKNTTIYVILLVVQICRIQQKN